MKLSKEESRETIKEIIGRFEKHVGEYKRIH